MPKIFGPDDKLIDGWDQHPYHLQVRLISDKQPTHCDQSVDIGWQNFLWISLQVLHAVFVFCYQLWFNIGTMKANLSLKGIHFVVEPAPKIDVNTLGGETLKSWTRNVHTFILPESCAPVPWIYPPDLALSLILTLTMDMLPKLAGCSPQKLRSIQYVSLDLPSSPGSTRALDQDIKKPEVWSVKA